MDVENNNNVATEGTAPEQEVNANVQSTEGQQQPTAETKKKGKKKRQPMGFGKTMLASALGFIIAIMIINVLASLVFFGLVAGVIAASQEAPVTGSNLIVRVDLTKEIAEQSPTELQGLMSNEKTSSLHDLLKAIHHAKTDTSVNALYLYMGDGGTTSWTQGEELRNAVLDFRTSGKPVLAFGNSYNQPAYYLATSASSILLNPAGMVDFRGLMAESLFFKEMLDRLGVGVELIRPNSNSFKSAGETYTMTSFSESNRTQVRSYLQSIWNHVVENISAARNMGVDSLNYIADNLEGVLASEARGCGLVDTLAFEAEAIRQLKECHKGKRIVDAVRYAKGRVEQPSDKHIAVIYAEGNVVGGEGDGLRQAVYGNDIAKALDDAVKNDKVKAIVLRINSPGGSAVASEVMTDAVIRAKQKKPVVVSMGGVAASAGYEMACSATKIVAQPVTLTGSIGVFGVVPEVGTMLRKKLGITTDTVATNANAAGLSVMRPMSPAARAMLQRNVEEFYVTFCMRVAEGRGLEVEYVDSIARGRVWTGIEACRLGLVDTLGGMDVAMQIAAQEAGIDKYAVTVYPAPKDLFDQLMDLTSTPKDIDLRMQIRQIIPFYDEMTYWAEMEPVQARLPFVINID